MKNLMRSYFTLKFCIFNTIYIFTICLCLYFNLK